MRQLNFSLLPIFLAICPTAAAQVAVELPKMNAMYEGVSNPICVVVNDLPDSCLLLRPSFGKIDHWRGCHFEWHGASDSLDVLQIELFDTCKNEHIGTRKYRLKQIPVEILLGAKHRSKAMSSGEFKAQGGIAAVVNCMDFDAKCDMRSFSVLFFRKKTGDGVSFRNTGARWTPEVGEHIQRVLPGDWVVFSNFSYRCPGDRLTRCSDEELIFQIK